MPINDGDFGKLMSFMGGGNTPSAPTAPSDAKGFGAKADALLSQMGGASGGSTGYTPTPGSSPESPMDESPLSIAERAQLGWVRTPAEQEKLLKSKYSDVAFTPTPEGGQGFVVKDKAGQWREVDPEFHWSGKGALVGAGAGLVTGGLPGALIGAGIGGAAPGMFDKNGVTNFAGSAAQWAGEYGLRTVGAVGAAAIAGPAGVAGQILAAGAGSALTDAADLGARAGTMDSSTPGARPYKNPDELMHQLGLSYLYGMEQEIGNKVVGKLFFKAPENLGNVIEKASLDGPGGPGGPPGGPPGLGGGKQAVKKVLTMMGMNDAQAEARVMDPITQATFDKVAAEDASKTLANKTMPKIQDGIFDNEIWKPLQSTYAREQGEFASLADHPAVKSASIDVGDALKEAESLLTQEGKIKPNGVVNEQRYLKEGDVASINRIMSQKPMSKGLTFQDARQLSQDVGSMLRGGDISDPIVYRAATLYKKGIDQAIINGLPEDVGIQYGNIMNKYSQVKELLTQAGKLDSVQRRQTFLSQLQKEGINKSSTLAQQLVSVGGVEEKSLYRLIQTQGAMDATHWFTGAKFLGMPVPTGGKAAAAVGNVASSVGGDLSKLSNSIPFIGEALSTLKKLSPASRSLIMKNPATVDTIQQTVGSAMATEAQTKQQLLQQAGVGQQGQQ